MMETDIRRSTREQEPSPPFLKISLIPASVKEWYTKNIHNRGKNALQQGVSNIRSQMYYRSLLNMTILLLLLGCVRTVACSPGAAWRRPVLLSRA